LIAPDRLAGLARKYRAMLELRHAGAPDETREDRARLRALAAEFPGALRELDTLPTEEIEGRARALEAAAAGSAAEPWMAWMADFHELLRTALVLKAAHARGLPRPTTDVSVDESFAAACERPPHGRLLPIVFARLAAHYQVSETVISTALFPPRR
jgi:hypothetical protein